MKKIKRISLTLVIVTLSPACLCLAQESFFPLNIGNVWYYRSIPEYYSIEVVDTIRIQGAQYYKVNWWGAKYFRLDSLNRLLEYKDGQVNVFLDFQMQVGDTLRNYESGFTTCIAKETVKTFIGTDDVQIQFYVNRDVTISESEWLVTLQRGVGIIEENYLSLSRGNLAGTILNGEQYGQVSVNKNPTVLVNRDINLEQNYPNPFNNSTTIRYEIYKRGLVKLQIFNGLGAEIALLENDFKLAGNYSTIWNPHDKISGIYYLKLSFNKYVQIRKILYLK